MMQSHLDYAGPSTEPALKVKDPRLALVAGLILGLLATATAARIEWLNHQCGALPKKYEGKWRALAASEKLWRDIEARTSGDATLTTRQLTTAEQQRLKFWLTRHRANGELRDLVAWGVLIYPIGLFGLGLCLPIVTTPGYRPRHRLLASVCTALFAISLTAAFYRGYFSAVVD